MKTTYANHKHNLGEMRQRGKRDFLLGIDTFAKSTCTCDECREAYYEGQGDGYLQQHEGRHERN